MEGILEIKTRFYVENVRLYLISHKKIHKFHRFIYY